MRAREREPSRPVRGDSLRRKSVGGGAQEAGGAARGAREPERIRADPVRQPAAHISWVRSETWLGPRPSGAASDGRSRRSAPCAQLVCVGLRAELTRVQLVSVCARTHQDARARSSLPFILPTPSAAARPAQGERHRLVAGSTLSALPGQRVGEQAFLASRRRPARSPKRLSAWSFILELGHAWFSACLLEATCGRLQTRVVFSPQARPISHPWPMVSTVRPHVAHAPGCGGGACGVRPHVAHALGSLLLEATCGHPRPRVVFYPRARPRVVFCSLRPLVDVYDHAWSFLLKLGHAWFSAP